MVPFVDMKRMHEPLRAAMESRFADILNRSAFVNGPEVKAFEESFAKWVGTKHCVGLSSGLDAEVIGLRCMGVKPGDKIIAPAMTFIATLEAITAVDAVPVLVDVDAKGLMDLNQAETALKAGARYMLPVHLFGELVDPKALRALADKYGAKIFEDACQAHGARKDGHTAGNIGHASAFSFYPGKNLGALGDGGALNFNDDSMIPMAKALREHGQTKKYYHEYEGYTARLDNLQAALLSVKLPRMDEWTQSRIRAAGRYVEKLQGLKSARLQSTALDGSHVYHLMVLVTPKREELSRAFEAAKIGFGYHYPFAIHQLPCYANREWAKGSFPNSEMYASQGVSMPIFPGMTDAEVDEVCSVVRSVCG